MTPDKTVFTWDNCEAEVSVTPVSAENGIYLYRITVDYPEKRFPERIKLRWFTEFDDIFSTWNPGGRFSHELMPSWRPVDTRSRSAAGAPVFSMMAKGSENRCTFALADAANPVRLTGGMEERSGKIECTVELFTDRVDMLDHYETLLRVDESRRPYYDAVYGVRQWWTETGYPAAHVPEDAKRTMFSSWYSFQKLISEEPVLEQCRMAKELGMDTVILDDGWQCDELVNGYSYCGDWEAVPSKFPDMRRFMDRLHAMEMKCILWYSVPFVGIYAKNFERFKNRYLRAYRSDGSVMVLDPRFADVREWLVETYVTALREWDLDGFKLDFIDSFSLAEDSSTDYDAMDCPSLEAAVEKLLDEIMTALKAVKPDVMIEFRQSYIGPVMQKYGNILRVGDCAGAALVNRVSSIDLRLLAGDPTLHETTAIHSDMLMWDYDASPEGAADQLAACLFCTAQISVMFEKLSPEHRKMLKWYMDFMDEYRDVLLGGKLKPRNPDANYTQVTAEKDGTVIAVMYADTMFTMAESAGRVILANASGRSDVYVKNCGNDAVRTYTIRNCMGDVIREGTVHLSGITEFDVPHNGFLYLE